MKMVAIKGFDYPAGCSSCPMMLNSKDYNCPFIEDGDFDLVTGYFVDCPLEEIEVKDESSSN